MAPFTLKGRALSVHHIAIDDLFHPLKVRNVQRAHRVYH